MDDGIGPPDLIWIARHHPGPALPHRADPAKGLLPDDFATLGNSPRSGHGPPTAPPERVVARGGAPTARRPPAR
ncbi:hypothetical protein HEK616_21480 [Streptomyces nigrescens]|uniref:Uncharacterized protein n=1 Tax=Streptomyces nigrescens TaxID=1920 RepID=A0ABN6QUL9_STRNI|nr:hypothetical protein HEK616_21480 [Streptomyces nigrescens]